MKLHHGIIGISFALAITGFAQNLVVNGSFETPALATGTHYHVGLGSLGPWQTTESQFEIWANPSPGESAIDGTQHLEILDSAATSSVFQAIPTTSGQSYTFSFFHSPRPGFNNVLTVSVASSVVGTFNEQGSVLSAFDWQEFTTSFTASSSTTTVTFTDSAITAPANGTHIDNVRVTSVPEPTSAALLLVGGVLLARSRSHRVHEPTRHNALCPR